MLFWSHVKFHFNSIKLLIKVGISSVFNVLDYLVESKMIEIPDCIKIDVDGTEELIIEGAKNTLLNSIMEDDYLQ